MRWTRGSPHFFLYSELNLSFNIHVRNLIFCSKRVQIPKKFGVFLRPGMLKWWKSQRKAGVSMHIDISLRNNMGFVLTSTGFLVLVSSLYFEDSMAKPFLLFIGASMIISAVLHEYMSRKRHQTLIEVFSLVLILLWGIFHLMIW